MRPPINKPLTPLKDVEKIFKGKSIKNFETTQSRYEKRQEKMEKEEKLSKEEAILIAKTYKHEPVQYTPQTIKENKQDIIGKFLTSVEKLIK